MHPDGAGFAYVKNGKVEVVKGLMDFDSFYTKYTKTLKRFPNSVYLIHFRTGTGGTITPENTHPFYIPKGALIHNGVMFTPDDKTGRSDTAILSETIGAKLKTPADWAINRFKFGDYVGRHNKFCILFDDGKFLIVNEIAGNWEDNVWYSNTYGWRGNTVNRVGSRGMN